MQQVMLRPLAIIVVKLASDPVPDIANSAVAALYQFVSWGPREGHCFVLRDASCAASLSEAGGSAFLFGHWVLRPCLFQDARSHKKG